MARTNNCSVAAGNGNVAYLGVTDSPTLDKRFEWAAAGGAFHAAQYPTITVDTDVTDPVSGEKFVPYQSESFSYDADGNLTQDGRWDYVWDGENRLVKLRSRSGSPAPERRIEFEYDWQGRRIRQTVWNDRDHGQGSEVSDTLYLYDGWNLIAELNANSSNAKVRTYIWGLDLSGTMQGAGGVGGLLMVIDHTGTTKRHFAVYDGNGNVMGLVDSTTGHWSARYEYGPFGEPLRVSGDLAYANPIRWSTKYTDGESGLVYYGYRFYNPSLGRWVSRDPLDVYQRDQDWLSRAGMVARVFARQNDLNSYHFIFNGPVDSFDAHGLEPHEGGPREGEDCCNATPCKVTATFEFVSIKPDVAGGGCSAQYATAWHIRVRVAYKIESGDCHILCCQYWTCNLRIPKPDGGWKGGACAGWTYDMYGDPDRFPNDNHHAKAMAGKLSYLTCENGRWKKKDLDPNGLHFGLGYKPPSAWLENKRVYP